MGNDLGDLLARMTAKIQTLERQMDFQERLEAGGGGGLVLLPAVSSYTLSAPITLNAFTEILFSGFSDPLPDCQMVLASILVFGTSSMGDMIQINANMVDTSVGNTVYITESVFTASSTFTIGGVLIPALTDRLRLYFNVDPSSPLFQVDLRVMGYIL